MAQDGEKAKRTGARPAASLILMREAGSAIEVLLGRRGLGHRFMPGLYVFPGGRVARSDARPWRGEAPAPSLHPPHRRFARAALRETFEETGLILGREAVEAPMARGARAPIEVAYAAHRLLPDLGLLRLIGRAITPVRSPIRFDALFFLADGRDARGELSGEELEELGWHRVDHGLPDPMPGVTRFMLQRALDVWRGSAAAEIPFYRHIGDRAIVSSSAAPIL
jgi:8-oxo-dGTP pyrophosphatase MutT (NUDIX family)